MKSNLSSSLLTFNERLSLLEENTEDFKNQLEERLE
jgi:hypothetical protein